jgi:hypothetical protein
MQPTRLQRTLAAVALAALLCFAAATAQAKPAGNWRVTFDGHTDIEGVIGLRIAPLEGTPIDVEIRIPAKTSENQVARLVSDGLKKILGTKAFRVGVDDGESVIVKKRGKTKNFELTMLTPPISGLGVKLERD